MVASQPFLCNTSTLSLLKDVAPGLPNFLFRIDIDASPATQGLEDEISPTDMYRPRQTGETVTLTHGDGEDD